MPVIKFVKEKKEIEVPYGANLRAEAVKAGLNLNCHVSGISDGVDAAVEKISAIANCHGFGLCGTCRVRITEGRENTGELTLREKLPSLAALGDEEHSRLACRTTVNGDITVETKPKLNIWGDNFFS